jgi:hypothetical protein
MLTAAALWERLDVPGHDACRLTQLNDGWELRGTAIFVADAGPAHISYLVNCGRNWHCRFARLQGWLAHEQWDLEITRSPNGEWQVGEEKYGTMGDVVDLDLGFTPATNLLHLRRHDLPVGASADIPVAWLDLPQATLTYLPQHYERRSHNTYWYESPTTHYAAVLEMAASGFVADYPGLWRLRTESIGPGSFS